MARELVDNTALRKAYLQDGRSPTAICEEIGWTHKDTSRLKRALGLMPSTCGPLRRRNGRTIVRRQVGTYYCKRCNADLALSLAYVLGLDPVDVGL